MYDTQCRRCTSKDAEERYSCGAYYSKLCDACWRTSGVRGSDYGDDDLNIVGGATENEIEAADYRDED